LIAKGARHLELIAETNEQFNLTRIVGIKEAAIKHTVDSVTPWKLFHSFRRAVDVGSGAGFPGIPLAIVFPDCHFVLIESTQKKARFIESAVAELGLDNVEVCDERGEDWLKSNRTDVATARAVAPLTRALPLFLPAARRGSQVLLYKGPDVESEIHELPARQRFHARIVERYELPESMGARTIVSLVS
jgi:16S rRNA (guanine527-N7)-methyltransferase